MIIHIIEQETLPLLFSTG